MVRQRLGAPFSQRYQADTRRASALLAERGLHGEIAQGEKAPIQAAHRWHVERTNAWHNAFNRLQRRYERREHVINAFYAESERLI